ncbi:hypothetical protein GCM10010276_69060 [Streptomyces longisporus]|uniref:Uncharacterized protein n=1 Tax=Streptomyces longisporus TaxID=1948 RepID=A0ABP6A7N6_STRLO
MSGITVGAGRWRGMWGLPGVRGMRDARGDAVETGGITLFSPSPADGRRPRPVRPHAATAGLPNADVTAALLRAGDTCGSADGRRIPDSGRIDDDAPGRRRIALPAVKRQAPGRRASPGQRSARRLRPDPAGLYAATAGLPALKQPAPAW